MAKKNKNDNDGLIAAFYGTKGFVKIKEAWNIGKIIFSFVQTDKDGKAERFVDYYMSIERAGCLARDILFGTLQRRAEEAVKKDPNTVLFMDQGGKPEGQANRSDGRALARVFTIIPAKAKGCPVCFRLEAGAGHSNQQGLIVPDWWGKSTPSAKEFDLLVPINNLSGVKNIGGEGDYIHNGPLDQSGIALLGAIQAYYTKGMLDGTLFTANREKQDNQNQQKQEPQSTAAQESAKPAATTAPASGDKPADPDVKTVSVVFHEPLKALNNNPNVYKGIVTGGDLVSEVMWLNKPAIGENRFRELENAAASRSFVDISYKESVGRDGNPYKYIV